MAYVIARDIAPVQYAARGERAGYAIMRHDDVLERLCDTSAAPQALWRGVSSTTSLGASLEPIIAPYLASADPRRMPTSVDWADPLRAPEAVIDVLSDEVGLSVPLAVYLMSCGVYSVAELLSAIALMDRDLTIFDFPRAIDLIVHQFEERPKNEVQLSMGIDVIRASGGWGVECDPVTMQLIETNSHLWCATPSSPPDFKLRARLYPEEPAISRLIRTGGTGRGELTRGPALTALSERVSRGSVEQIFDALARVRQRVTGEDFRWERPKVRAAP